MDLPDRHPSGLLTTDLSSERPLQQRLGDSNRGVCTANLQVYGCPPSARLLGLREKIEADQETAWPELRRRQCDVRAGKGRRGYLRHSFLLEIKPPSKRLHAAAVSLCWVLWLQEREGSFLSCDPVPRRKAAGCQVDHSVSSAPTFCSGSPEVASVHRGFPAQCGHESPAIESEFQAEKPRWDKGKARFPEA